MPCVPPEGKLIGVAVRMLRADVVERPDHAALEQPEE
jgi:hypothetical protein